MVVPSRKTVHSDPSCAACDRLAITGDVTVLDAVHHPSSTPVKRKFTIVAYY